MDIFVLRHGETDWNKENRIQGSIDIPLNQEGIKQAKETRDYLKHYKIDLIICSPLKRAIQTANIINEVLNCEIKYSEALKERNFGEYEGKKKQELNDDQVIRSGILFNYEVNKKYKGIEPIKDFYERVYLFLNELKETSNSNILLVTHGGTINIINTYFNGFDKQGYIRNLATKNAKVLKYKLK